MKTMNKFWKYFLNFIILFLLVSGFVELGTKNLRSVAHKIEYTSLVDSIPASLDVSTCEATTRRATIKGSITNNSKNIITDKYLKFSFLNSSGKVIKNEYKSVKYFNVNEDLKFEVTAKCRNADRIEISLVDTMETSNSLAEDISDMFSSFKITDKEITVGVLLALPAVLKLVLP